MTGEQLCLARVAARLHDHDAILVGAVEQHLRKASGSQVGHPHPRAHVLQETGEVGRKPALGLESHDVQGRAVRQTRDDILPFARFRAAVDLDDAGDGQVQVALQRRLAAAGLQHRAQAFADRPRRDGHVELERCLQLAEVPVAEAAAEPAHRRGADGEFGGQRVGGLERHCLPIGEQEVRDHPFGRGHPVHFTAKLAEQSPVGAAWLWRHRRRLPWVRSCWIGTKV